MQLPGENSQPIYRVFGERPQFHLRDLEPGNYQVMVYAENSKGRSYPPVVLRNIRVVPDVAPPEMPLLQQESGMYVPEGRQEKAAK